MKTYRLSGYLVLLAVLILIVSCEKQDNENKVYGDYLYEYELLSSYTEQQVKEKLFLGSLVIPGLDTLISSSEYGVDVYRILYQTSFNSEDIIASGLVCIPTSSGSFPIISFQNGTNTCHSNAPSENPSDIFYSLISIMAGSGYVITIPDYVGFGESVNILHPYHHKESSNAAVVDLLLAAQELITSSVIQSSMNNELYLMGYSQGGWATMSVLKELEINSTGGFVINAAACGAGAYNLVEMSKHVLGLDEYSNPFYLPYFIESRRQNGILNEALTMYFNQPYANDIPDLFDGTLCNSEMNDQFPSRIAEMLTPDFIANFETSESYAPLRAELQKNSIDTWSLQADLRIYHSTGDNSVPSFLSENMYNDFIDQGVPPAKITLVKEELLDHNDAINHWGIDALAWINSLEGK